eukprot:g9535.t1
MPAPPVVVVPSAAITQLGLRIGGGENSAFAWKQISQHPEWRLDDDEKVDWSKFRGRVLDASCSTLPTLSPIATAASTFTRLTVLCLRESGVVDIELLQPCVTLVHLDLSSNEIVDLVMEWRAVGGLGKAPKLTYLTLFFNPVCKRKIGRFGVSAAVKIQAVVRKWLVRRRSIDALKDILRKSGELYLIQESLTPTQLRSLAWFQRRVAGHFRLKVLITCTKTIERFMGKVAKQFSALVDSLEAAQVGGVVVGQHQSGDLAAAVARALVVTTPGLTWVEAAERTATMVTIVPDCRLLRPFSYADMPDWPTLDKDVDTDGVFVTRNSAVLIGFRRETATAKRRRASTIAGHEQLWVFRPPQARMLARILCTLRNGAVGKPPVPFVLERHLISPSFSVLDSEVAKHPGQVGPPVELGASHREVELLELTFSSAEEARARAVLLALGTEEPGVRPNRPVAHLMTLEMLRRAAAGEPGKAAPTLKSPAQGFRSGDTVEVSVFRLSEGRGGAWFSATVDRKDGASYQVTLENGLGELRVPQGGIRPLDRTGKEPALVEMSHLPSRWQQGMRSRLTPADRLEMELLRRSLRATTAAESSSDGGPVQLLSGKPQRGVDLFAPTDDPRQLDGLDCRGLALVEPRPTSPGSPLGRSLGGGVLAPSPPRWASSQTMAAARSAGGLAAEAMEKVARAAAAADEAASASTWVPGNRFRMGLERLVRLDAHELQEATEKARLSARRDTVSRARQAERAESSPRDRLERLKAAEADIFRRESDEINHRAAFEKAIHERELRVNAVEAREYMLKSRKHVAETLETRRANKMADSRRREGEAEAERRRSLEKRQADVHLAKARAAKRREDRAKQALSLAESRTFTANASQLARHVGKHASMAYKAQHARGVRQWVKGQRLHKEEMRRRMLRRVQELQEQKRNEGTRLRKALAARGRARAAIDEAVIHHRAGHTIPPGGDLDEKILHVLRPRSRLQAVNSGQNDGGEPALLCEEDAGHYGTHAGRVCDRARSQSPAGTGHAVMEFGRPPGDGTRRGTTVPCKPEATRLHAREHRNRRLSADDGGKTVVVLASVPRVAREARSTKSPPQGAALLGSPSKEAVKKAAPDQAVLPWPLSRRCW